MPDNPKPAGCLGIAFKLLGLAPSNDPSADPSENIATADADQFPYKQRDAFLSPAELAFYRVLDQAVGTRFAINNKVRLWDVIYVPRFEGSRSYENKIQSKHLDFLLCDPATMQPVLAIELDDASHQRKDRQARDTFVDRALTAAGIPILHIPAARDYSTTDLPTQINNQIPTASPTQPKPPPVQTSPTPPACPKCSTAMVQRKAAKGQHAGKRFWACPNYPKCRQIIGID